MGNVCCRQSERKQISSLEEFPAAPERSITISPPVRNIAEPISRTVLRDGALGLVPHVASHEPCISHILLHETVKNICNPTLSRNHRTCWNSTLDFQSPSGLTSTQPETTSSLAGGGGPNTSTTSGPFGFNNSFEPSVNGATSPSNTNGQQTDSNLSGLFGFSELDGESHSAARQTETSSPQRMGRKGTTNPKARDSIMAGMRLSLFDDSEDVIVETETDLQPGSDDFPEDTYVPLTSTPAKPPLTFTRPILSPPQQHPELPRKMSREERKASLILSRQKRRQEAAEKALPTLPDEPSDGVQKNADTAADLAQQERDREAQNAASIDAIIARQERLQREEEEAARAQQQRAEQERREQDAFIAAQLRKQKEELAQQQQAEQARLAQEAAAKAAAELAQQQQAEQARLEQEAAAELAQQQRLQAEQARLEQEAAAKAAAELAQQQQAEQARLEQETAAKAAAAKRRRGCRVCRRAVCVCSGTAEAPQPPVVSHADSGSDTVCLSTEPQPVLAMPHSLVRMSTETPDSGAVDAHISPPKANHDDALRSLPRSAAAMPPPVQPMSSSPMQTSATQEVAASAAAAVVGQAPKRKQRGCRQCRRAVCVCGGSNEAATEITHGSAAPAEQPAPDALGGASETAPVTRVSAEAVQKQQQEAAAAKARAAKADAEALALRREKEAKAEQEHQQQQEAAAEARAAKSESEALALRREKEAKAEQEHQQQQEAAAKARAAKAEAEALALRREKEAKAEQQKKQEEERRREAALQRQRDIEAEVAVHRATDRQAKLAPPAPSDSTRGTSEPSQSSAPARQTSMDQARAALEARVAASTPSTVGSAPHVASRTPTSPIMDVPQFGASGSKATPPSPMKASPVIQRSHCGLKSNEADVAISPALLKQKLDVKVSPLSPVAPQSPKSKEAATDIATGKSESAPAKIPSESKGAPSPKTGRGLSRRIARSLKRNKSGKGTSLKKKSFLGRGKRTAVGNADVVIATDSTGVSLAGVAAAKVLAHGLKSSKMQTVAEILAGSPDDVEWEDLDPRAIEAAQWTDREINKVIEQVKLHGTKNEQGQWQVTFGTMFNETAQIFDALSGILKTSKKYKVLDFAGEQLWQGQHDDTVITLINEVHTGIKIRRRRKADLKSAPSNAKSSGFGHGFSQDAKCVICEKRIYQAEFVGAGGKSFHDKCFRCIACDKRLKQNDYYVSRDNGFRCKKCHTEFERTFM